MKKSRGRRRTENGEESSGGGWELVYSGFAMILLCFFIMLSSFSKVQEAKVMKFVRSFADAVSVLTGGAALDDGSVVHIPAAPMVRSDHPLASLMNDLKKLAQQERVEADVSLSMTAEGLAMRLSDRALFDLGAAELSEAARRLMRQIGEIIAKTDHQIRIEGHTDDLPIRTARYPSNWELSTARAVNVLRFLEEEQHIAAERLSAEGFGEFKPLLPNDSPAHRARNRRVEIIFLDRAGTRVGGGHSWG